MFTIKTYPKVNHGLTLIEVLIALAVISIALTAIIKSTTENIRATHYLENKLIAMWVGSQIINEARVGILVLPSNEDQLQIKTKMLDKKWISMVREEATPNIRIKKLVVKVFPNQENIDDDTQPFITLDSYVYHQE